MWRGKRQRQHTIRTHTHTLTYVVEHSFFFKALTVTAEREREESPPHAPSTCTGLTCSVSKQTEVHTVAERHHFLASPNSKIGTPW